MLFGGLVQRAAGDQSDNRMSGQDDLGHIHRSAADEVSDRTPCGSVGDSGCAQLVTGYDPTQAMTALERRHGQIPPVEKPAGGIASSDRHAASPPGPRRQAPGSEDK
jgi:hypothetical protein